MMNRKDKLLITFVIFIIIISSDLCLITYAALRRRTFESDWFDTKFTIIVESDDTWHLPNNYDVKLDISVYWMGMNYKIRIDKISVGLGSWDYSLTREEKIVNKILSHVGDTYSTTVTLKCPSTLYFIRPGETSGGSIYILIEGWAENEYGNRWPCSTYKNFDIDIKAPTILITTGYELSKEAIYVGDQFSLDILVQNDSNYPIFNVAVEISPSFTLSVVGLNKKSIEKLEPKQITRFTFYLKAEQIGEGKIIAYTSYKTSWGYECPEYENRLEIFHNVKERVNEVLLLIVVASIVIGVLGVTFYLKTKRRKTVPSSPLPPPS
ncbi:MAG: hypothetical protein QXS66_08535 [Thermoproteota archaeon]